MPFSPRRRMLAFIVVSALALVILYIYRRPVKAWVHAIYKEVMPRKYPASFPLKSAREVPAHARKVLFIGNSLTFYNQMPFLVEELTRKSEQPLSVALIAMPLWNLSDHRKAGAIQFINNEKWDYVVIQEHSVGITEKNERYRTDARAFIEAIKAAGAKPVLYQTWSDRGEPEKQSAISAAISQLAKESGSIVVPVGDVFHALRTEAKSPDLYTLDGKHPSATGSYAAAMTFYSVLSGQSPLGLPATVELQPMSYPDPLSYSDGTFRLDAATALQIQKEAAKKVEGR